MAQQTTCPVACLFTSAHYSANATNHESNGQDHRKQKCQNIKYRICAHDGPHRRIVSGRIAAVYRGHWGSFAAALMRFRSRQGPSCAGHGIVPAEGSAVRLADCPQANSPATRSDIVRGMSKAPLTDSYLYALRPSPLARFFVLTIARSSRSPAHAAAGFFGHSPEWT